jgi:hypothetical protein
MSGGQGRPSRTTGQNHPGGVMVHFYVKDTTKVQASLEFMDLNSQLIKKFSTKPDKKNKEEKLSIEKLGMNRFVWNMRYPEAETFEGMILWWASTNGPRALPGKYKVKLTVNGQSQETEFEILKDPRSSTTEVELKAQFDFQQEVLTKLSETNLAIKKIRLAREQINRVTNPIKDKKDELKDLLDLAKSIQDKMKKIEEALYQTKNRSGQDPLNFPIRLNNKLGHLNSIAGIGDFKPTDQDVAYKKEVTAKIDQQLSALNKIFTDDIESFNRLVKEKQLDAVVLND